jgi:hypothetical protein
MRSSWTRSADSSWPARSWRYFCRSSWICTYRENEEGWAVSEVIHISQLATQIVVQYRKHLTRTPFAIRSFVQTRLRVKHSAAPHICPKPRTTDNEY